MKLSSQELEQLHYKVLFRDEENKTIKIVVDPIEADTTAGTVTMTVISKVPYKIGEPLAIPTEEVVTRKGEVWILDSKEDVVAYGPSKEG